MSERKSLQEQLSEVEELIREKEPMKRDTADDIDHQRDLNLPFDPDRDTTKDTSVEEEETVDHRLGVEGFRGNPTPNWVLSEFTWFYSRNATQNPLIRTRIREHVERDPLAVSGPIVDEVREEVLAASQQFPVRRNGQTRYVDFDSAMNQYTHDARDRANWRLRANPDVLSAVESDMNKFFEGIQKTVRSEREEDINELKALYRDTLELKAQFANEFAAYGHAYAVQTQACKDYAAAIRLFHRAKGFASRVAAGVAQVEDPTQPAQMAANAEGQMLAAVIDLLAISGAYLESSASDEAPTLKRSFTRGARDALDMEAYGYSQRYDHPGLNLGRAVAAKKADEDANQLILGGIENKYVTS